MDRYSQLNTGLTSPAMEGFAVTPHDTNELAETTRALFVGGSGAIAVTFRSGGPVILSGVAAGSLLPIRVTRVLATGTTATDIVGLI